MRGRNPYMNIAFIGTGVMGRSMVRNLLKEGHTVQIYTRTKTKAASLIEEGAEWHDSVKQCVRKVDAVMTMLGYPEDVRDVYQGKQGILQSSSKGTLLIDFTTSSPTLATQLAEEAEDKKLHMLDAPVSGGDIGAQNGTLSIMVGGKAATVEEVRPLFECLGTQVVHHGPSGAGQLAKLSNQIAIASNMMGVVEALRFAEVSRLDPQKVLQSIQGGAAGSWSLTNLAPRMLANDTAPGFYVEHFVKDLRIALEEAKKLDLPLPGLQKAAELYEGMLHDSMGQLGTQALYVYYQNFS
ncbi:NAD(P)-dependent oxidoreductase [Bacillaceae bacterium SIJ1]|uniref:NAD(P)-dependent oxidoreductase n=1 Tax=Litoribacterium kuwaitense TaxID=1398745 RepID=UPI0013EC2975|nr:NAD(P)-dependent oxidoreductase [Litoribacterium kuwaitense]NGP43967.1 NAD(P)-dependent oxidoreductase [Litoribacterium kuwaitense]